MNVHFAIEIIQTKLMKNKKSDLGTHLSFLIMTLYQDFYLKSDTLLLAHVFENSRKICVEIYELFPAKFLLAPRLAW